MILAENNVVFPNSDSKITINTYKIRLGQKLRMLPNTLVDIAIGNANKISIANYITFVREDSLDFIQKGDHIGKYDIVYFDSSRKIRPEEFYALRDRNLLNKGCFLIFHDTCKCPIKEQGGDADIQSSYLSALDEIRKKCDGLIRFELSRGLYVFQY